MSEEQMQTALNEEERQQLHEFLSLMEQANPETQEDVYRILMEGKV